MIYDLCRMHVVRHSSLLIVELANTVVGSSHLNSNSYSDLGNK